MPRVIWIKNALFNKLSTMLIAYERVCDSWGGIKSKTATFIIYVNTAYTTGCSSVTRAPKAMYVTLHVTLRVKFAARPLLRHFFPLIHFSGHRDQIDGNRTLVAVSARPTDCGVSDSRVAYTPAPSSCPRSSLTRVHTGPFFFSTKRPCLFLRDLLTFLHLTMAARF